MQFISTVAWTIQKQLLEMQKWLHTVQIATEQLLTRTDSQFEEA